MLNLSIPSRPQSGVSRRIVLRKVVRGAAVVGLVGLGAGFMLGSSTEAAYVDRDVAQPATAANVQTRQILTTIEIGTYAGYGRLPDQRWLAWGDRRWGGGTASTSQLRLNDITDAPALAGNTFERLYSGNQASFAIDNQGNGYFWGTNADGLFANGSAVATRSDLPQRGLNTGSLTGKRLASMCLSNDAVMAIDTNGGLHSWGVNTNGRLGTGNLTNQTLPVQVTGLAGKVITSCVITQSHTLAIDSTGTLYAWGLGTSGQLGQGALTSSYTPLAVPGISNVAQIAAAQGYSLALDTNNRLWSWGSNRNGILGLGAISDEPIAKPQLVNGRGALEGKQIRQIETTFSNVAFALTSDGKLYSWGTDFGGAMATGVLSAAAAEPIAVESTSSSLAGVAVTQISCGSNTCMARDSNGYAHAWGYAGYYVFGNGSNVSTGMPQAAVY